jgi:hypothetical protein
LRLKKQLIFLLLAVVAVVVTDMPAVVVQEG